jgi:predicted Zn-dependent protease
MIRPGWRRLTVLACLAFVAAILSAQTPKAPRAEYDSRLAAAEALFNKGAGDDAARAFEQLVMDDPARPEPFWYLGVMAFQQNQLEKAIAAFEDLTSRQPARGAGWVMLGLSEFRLKRYDSALPHLEQGRFLGGGGNPQLDQLATVAQAALCTRIGRFDVALAVLSELAIRNVKSPTVVATFGLAALNRAQMLEDVPAEDQRLVIEAGEAAWAVGAKQTEASIRMGEALLQRYPQTAGLRYILGTALLRNNWERAEQELRAELNANSGHFFANVTLASELSERGRSEEAVPFARQAVALRADHMVAQTLLGRALLQTGKVDEAITHLEEAAKLDPQNPNVRYSLAAAYARAGRKEEAEQQRALFAKLQAEAGKKP